MLPLLKRVSRSFYLSIRLLPSGMREPVAVAYLLARAADTIADSASIDVSQRASGLDDLSRRVGTFAHHDAPLPGTSAELANFPPGPERDLIAALPRCLRWLDELGTDDAADVREVLGRITRGQQLDLQRTVLHTVAELDEYTYLVAGCVGEFWTRVAERHARGFAKLPVERMLELGRSYGQGLQLVNILRDASADAALGRRYLPTEEPDAAHWMARARDGINAGMQYALAVEPRRLRVASALPALLGARTLDLIERVKPGDAPAKMARSEVRALLWRTALGLGSRASLQSLYAQWDNPRP